MLSFPEQKKQKKLYIKCVCVFSVFVCVLCTEQETET